MNAQEKIIVALDVATAAEARRAMEDLRAAVGAFKIGLQLFTSEGASFVREAAATGAKIFLDVKFHDIPNTVARAAIEAARLGVWMFNVHAGGGAEMMRRTVEAVRETCAKENLTAPKIIAVTVLTSADQETLRAVGIEKDLSRHAADLAKLAADCELDGAVASAHEIAAIRQAVGRADFMIVTPGIRASFATSDDQKRVMAAREALAAGADYLVVGRPIMNAADRRTAAESLLKEIAVA